MSASDAGPHRLPESVLPRRYDLTLEPDLDGEAFAGSLRISLEVREPVSEIVLNVAELELGDPWLQASGGATLPVALVSVDPASERAFFALGRRLDPGEYALELSFRGVLNDKLTGFYRSTFTDERGLRHSIAATQLQSTHARSVFPCFDEPAFKAVFGITVVVPEHLTAVSNAPVVSEESAGNGRKRVRFADTIRMSTYLVALVVGPFEATAPVDVDGVALRVLHVPGKGGLASYALRAGEFALRFFSEYFAIPYPGKKLDMIAIPDFAYGAMENFGCITYREVLLLVDETRATQTELMRVAEVIAHEIAHMWFGDLVTMKWWNGIWLNEAFATFAATSCTDAFNPEWRRWEQFRRDRTAALEVDALTTTRPVEFEVVSPSDAEGMFDILTYQKGASVLRMVEQYLGPGPFRDGIRRYLARHAYGNTETEDLWSAIEEATGEPVRRIMGSWIFRPGFPVVTVSAADARTLEVGQRRFLYDRSGSSTGAEWAVPLILRVAAGGERHTVLRLVETGSTRILFDGGADWVLANAGGHGFYRVRCTPELSERLLDRMMTDLEPVERYGLVDDAWASVLAGDAEARGLLSLAARFGPETDLDVWTALTGCLEQLERFLEGEPRSRYRSFLRALCGPALGRLGWEPQPGEPTRARALRGLLVRSLAAAAGDDESLARSRELHAKYLRHRSSVEPHLAAAAAAAVASEGSAADYESFLGRFREAETPQEEARYRSLLAAFPGRDEMTRTLGLALGGPVRTQDAPYLVAACLDNRAQGDVAWAFVKANWDRMLREYPGNAMVRMLGGVRVLSTPELCADVHRFFETHRVPQGQRTLDQHLERLRVNAALRERETARLAGALLRREVGPAG